jgi:hypothetical protein
MQKVILSAFMLLLVVGGYIVYTGMSGQRINEYLPQYMNMAVPSTTPSAEINVDPLCFYVEDAAPLSFPMSDCMPGLIREAEAVTDEDGFQFVEFSYDIESEASEYNVGGVFRYKDLGPIENDRLVHIEYSTGGTGYFSSLDRVRIEDDRIMVVKNYAAGDRCNGGIAGDVLINGGVVAYSQNITPADLPALVGLENKKTHMNEALETCAVCCIGLARFQNDEFKGISFTAEPQRLLPGREGVQPYQQCFNTLVAESYANDAFNFNAEMTGAFVAQFHADCDAENMVFDHQN